MKPQTPHPTIIAEMGIWCMIDSICEGFIFYYRRVMKKSLLFGKISFTSFHFYWEWEVVCRIMQELMQICKLFLWLSFVV